MEDGKRLENLSWRLWNRETFCCNAKQPRSTTPSPRRCSLTHNSKTQAVAVEENVPELSSSLESASSEELDETMRPAPAIPKARPELLERIDSSESKCRSEKHITPVDLEKLVLSIKETQVLEPIDIQMPSPPSRSSKDPLLAAQSPAKIEDLPLRSHPTATHPQKQPYATSHDSAPQPASASASHSTLLESSASTVDTNDDDASQTVGSEGSSNTEVSMENHSIVRGFIAGGAPSSYRSQTNLAAQPTPILKKSPPAHQMPKKRGGAMFTIGTSSGEEESSLESHMYKSSLSESLRRPNSNVSGASGRKQTSFKEEVAVGRAAEHSPVFDESDEEDDEVSESAIEEEDDDSSEWEDSDEPSGPSSVNEKEYFQRVDSRPNLTSRRSMLTSMMHEPDRAKALQNEASRSTPALRRSRTSTPNGPSLATSPEPDAQLHVPGQGPTRPKPIIMTTSNTQQPLSLSPRTTRRNMLSTELTESLRKNLLWERQHRSTGNLAALKRRHTSNDVKNLKQHPEPGPVLSHQDGAKRFNNDYFHAGLGEYHAKGW